MFEICRICTDETKGVPGRVHEPSGINVRGGVSQPPTVVCKMEAQLEYWLYAHCIHFFFAGADL